MLKLLKIKATRKYLTTKACMKTVIALVMTHLDYANSILAGLPKASITSTAKSTEYGSKNCTTEKQT